MRWVTVPFAMVASLQIYGLVHQHRTAAQIAGLSQEIRDLRAQLGRGSGPVVLAPEEHLVLDQMMAARLGRAEAPERAETPPQPPREQQPAPREPSPSERAAAEQGARILDAALSSGTLRRDDLLELRRLLAQADPAAAGELRRRLAVAINRDELRPIDPSAGIP
jgi:hypothetical protein